MIGGLFNSYEEYLLSDIWIDKRDYLISKESYCEICKSNKNLQVHHKTYENVCNEKRRDLLVVCRKCHENIHEVDK